MNYYYFTLHCHVNADGMSVSDLKLLEQEAREINQAFASLEAYARIKILAMELRSKGEISQALLQERQCDALYNQMPKWARW